MYYLFKTKSISRLHPAKPCYSGSTLFTKSKARESFSIILFRINEIL